MRLRLFRYIIYGVLFMLALLFILFMAALTSNNPPPEIAELARHQDLVTIIHIFFFISCLYGMFQFFWIVLERENKKVNENALSELEKQERKERHRKNRLRHGPHQRTNRKPAHLKPFSGVNHE